MVNVEVIRLETSKKYGTFGVLKVNKSFYCCTLEPPDQENQEDKSSIPTGQYTCKRIKSPKFGDTYEVSDVTARSNVLFHAGNVVGHTSGCIILGQHIGKLRGKKAVLNSGKTFDRFMDLMSDNKRFHLTVSEVY